MQIMLAFLALLLLFLLPYVAITIGVYMWAGLPAALIVVGILALLTFLVIWRKI